MTSRRGPTLAERSAASGVRPIPASSGRHCWVVGIPSAPGRWPGLLAEWRRTAAGWEGRVIYAVDDDGATVLVEAWVAADALERA